MKRIRSNLAGTMTFRVGIEDEICEEDRKTVRRMC